MSAITKLEANHNLDKLLEQNSKKLVLLFFAASWSEESNLMGGVLEELVKQKSSSENLQVISIEAEEFEELSVKYGVDSVPTFVFLRNGRTVNQLCGANPAELKSKLTQLTASFVPSSGEAQTKTKENLNDRLKRLVNASPIVLFMKGDPSEPRCGFSRQTIELFKTHNIKKFTTFDILSDDEVRQGLKKYSEWPTFPQIYVKGEFVGGLDILKELIENKEIEEVFSIKEESMDDKLKKLVNQANIMLFMKGNRDEPKCGFSKQTIAILNETGEKYETFDILSDEEVRQALKEYSKWPTYPQLYVKGEFQGGLDIIKELKENGDLLETLKQ